MVKYFLGQSVLRSSWDQVFAAFGQRYPNPYRYVALERAVLPSRCLEIEVWGREGLDIESEVGDRRNRGHL